MKVMRRGKRERGSSLLEFTLVGIPMIFVLISVFELSRGMWNYHTMAYSVNEGARYAVVHGKGCSAAGNTCGITVSDVARKIREAGIGLADADWDVTLQSKSGSISCTPLSTCLTDKTPWPPIADGDAGMDLRISAQYRFRSAIALLWPGVGSVKFGTFVLPAYSRQRIQF